MAYSDIASGIAKIESSSPTLRSVRRASMVGVVLPVGSALDELLPAALFISMVSLLDEGLERLIDVEYPSAPKGLTRLARRIEYLKAEGRLLDAAALTLVKDARNSYAHEPGKYPSWQNLSDALTMVSSELRHLHIV